MASGSASGSSSESASGSLQKINIPIDGTTFDAYLTGKENAPGIVVVQAYWGVDDEIKNHALHIAQMNPGYRTLIPDLYRGKVGLYPGRARELMNSLDWQGAVEDIRASVKWLKATGSSKVGVTGFSMGGALSIASAVLVPEVDAVVAFYGLPCSDLADTKSAKAPVQAHFGERDKFVEFYGFWEKPKFLPFANADEAAMVLKRKLESSGTPYQIHTYPAAGHDFMDSSPDGIERKKIMCLGLDDHDPGDHDPAAAGLAWCRFSSWMSHYLLSP